MTAMVNRWERKIDEWAAHCLAAERQKREQLEAQLAIMAENNAELSNESAKFALKYNEAKCLLSLADKVIEPLAEKIKECSAQGGGSINAAFFIPQLSDYLGAKSGQDGVKNGQL
jgi:hypothetical protein